MANRLQLATYLLGICLFSICFLVFVNATISFVITDILHQTKNVGNATGTLGFADELLAVIACPFWGLLSDRVGIRNVSVLGYVIIAASFFLLVQSVNIYPQLLLGRLLFSLGASSASTMVTAILPLMVSKLSPHIDGQPILNSSCQAQSKNPVHSRLAGFVGFFTGLGALLAVGVFLPLPSRLQQRGLPPEVALADTYYIAGAIGLLIAIVCYVGLGTDSVTVDAKGGDFADARRLGARVLASLAYLPKALRLGFAKPSLGLGFLASFVARSSSVGISLFIPLFVNARLCHHPAHDVGDVKENCRQAYVVAAQLSGISQLFALLFAPIFGYLPSQHGHFHVPLMAAALSGIVGYITFAKMNTSEVSPILFVVVALLGISQIGAIVSSLSLVSSSVLEEASPSQSTVPSTSSPAGDHGVTTPLLNGRPRGQTHEYLKGTIAGVYSFSGSLAILILTKLGGLLFDLLGSETPFYLLAFFNFLLLVAVLVCGVLASYQA